MEETLTLQHAKKLIQCMAHEQSFLLLSPPGVGKSEIVYQAAREANLPCRSLLGTQIAPEDVSGVPRIVGERSVFCPPRLLLPETAEPFCLFLDELPACAPDVQKAFYSLLLERRLGEHALPAGTWVVAAGNRLQDRALVRAMSSALVNRVTILQLRIDVEEWLGWAQRSGVRAEIRSFIATVPDALMRPNQYVTARVNGFSRPNAILVPQRAVHQAESGHFVWVIDKDNLAQYRPIEVGDWHGDDWFITAGLKPGEKVIVDGLVFAPKTDVDGKPLDQVAAQ